MYTRPHILNTAWCETKYQIWSLQMMTQLRASNAGPQNKIQSSNDKYNKIQIDNTIAISNGDLQKEYCTIFQYPESCNADQGSLMLATGHTHKKQTVNKTCHHLLLIPDPDPSLNCWGGNPYCLVLLSGFKSNWNVDNVSMKCLSSKPQTVVPCWPFCTGKQKAHTKCTHTFH